MPDHLIEFIEEEIEVLRAALSDPWVTRWRGVHRQGLDSFFSELDSVPQINMSKVWRWNKHALGAIAVFVQFTADGITAGSVLQVMLWGKARRIAEYANASAVDRLAWLAKGSDAP